MKHNKNNIISIRPLIETNKHVINPKRSLFFRIQKGNSTFRIPTGIKIEAKYWDNIYKRVRKSHVDSLEINNLLKEQERVLWSIWREFSLKQPLDFSQFKGKCMKALHNEVEKTDTFFDEYENFLKSLENTKRAKGTIQKYKTLKKLLINYQETQKSKLNFFSFNKEFEDKFQAFLFGINHTNNTVGKYISSLKTFLNWGLEMKLHTNIEFKKFKVPNEDSEIFYLKKDELDTLYKTDFSNEPELAHVRDFICFECFTGQRYSDVANLSFSDIDFDTKFWHLRVIKTKLKNSIPLSERAMKILERNRHREKPFNLRNYEVNDRIKIISKLLNMNDEVKTVRFRGSERIETTSKKFEKIASHIGRRTFIILSLEDGMPTEVVKSITGHKTDKSFKKYISIVPETKRFQMDRVWNSM